MPYIPVGSLSGVVNGINTAQAENIYKGTKEKHAALKVAVEPANAREVAQMHAQHVAIDRAPDELMEKSTAFLRDELLLAQNEEGDVAVVDRNMAALQVLGKFEKLVSADFEAIERDLGAEILEIQGGRSDVSFTSAVVLGDRLTQAGTHLSA